MSKDPVMRQKKVVLKDVGDKKKLLRCVRVVAMPLKGEGREKLSCP